MEPSQETDNSDQPEKHLEGEGHAHHRFNPERAEEFRDPDRLDSLNLDAMADVLNIESGHTVLDLGTGSGAYLPWLSEVTGPDGTVIAADINDKMLSMALEYVRGNDTKRVVLLKNEPASLQVVSGSVDRVLIVSSLHEFSRPADMLVETNRLLAEEGRIGILEWRYEEMEEGPPLEHRLEPATVKEWLDQGGFGPVTVENWSAGYDLYRSNTKKNED
jgi:ubiquinone/menaquinone biosynthesis C-methylase UbiE